MLKLDTRALKPLGSLCSVTVELVPPELTSASLCRYRLQVPHELLVPHVWVSSKSMNLMVLVHVLQLTLRDLSPAFCALQTKYIILRTVAFGLDQNFASHAIHLHLPGPSVVDRHFPVRRRRRPSCRLAQCQQIVQIITWQC